MRQCLAPGIHQIHNGDILICVICPEDQRGLTRLFLNWLHIAFSNINVSLSNYWQIVLIVNTQVKMSGNQSYPMVLWCFFKSTTPLLVNPTVASFPQFSATSVCSSLISLFFKIRSARKSQIFCSSFTERIASFFLFHAIKQSLLAGPVDLPPNPTLWPTIKSAV